MWNKIKKKSKREHQRESSASSWTESGKKWTNLALAMDDYLSNPKASRVRQCRTDSGHELNLEISGLV